MFAGTAFCFGAKKIVSYDGISFVMCKTIDYHTDIYTLLKGYGESIELPSKMKYNEGNLF